MWDNNFDHAQSTEIYELHVRDESTAIYAKEACDLIATNQNTEINLHFPPDPKGPLERPITARFPPTRIQIYAPQVSEQKTWLIFKRLI